MIAIIDYGMGNLRSIQNKLQRLDADACITSDPLEIEKANKLILPGVGHFATGMENLRSRRLIDPIGHKVVDHHTPILGICLGMQLFSRHSAEGDVPGLGYIDAETVRLPPNNVKIPHMGWNTLENRAPCVLFDNLPEDAELYFVHSFHVQAPKAVIASTTDYGITFASTIHQNNIYGTQFHPEKSHGAGMTILRNFLEKA